MIGMKVYSYQVLFFSLMLVTGSAATSNCSRYGDLRLTGGSSLLEGRVEVCNERLTWNRICNDGWDDEDAGVVCKQLGLSPVGSIAVRQQQVFEVSSANGFLFNQVDCSGSESRLIDCPIELQYPNVLCDTSGTEDAAVRCTNESLVENLTSQHSGTTITLSWNATRNDLIDHFTITCFHLIKGTKYIAQSIIPVGNLTTQLNSPPGTTHNCCVSAVVERYDYRSGVCTEITTSPPADNLSCTCVSSTIPDANNNNNNNSCNMAIVGTLSFLVVLLLLLLTLSAVALAYFILIRNRRYRSGSSSKSMKCFEAKIDSNPSYSSVSIIKDVDADSVCMATERTYDVVNKSMKSTLSQSTVKNEYEDIKEASVPGPRSSEEAREMHIKPNLSAEKSKFEANPAYGSLPRSLPGTGEYAVVGQPYHKSRKVSKISTNGYEEIQETAKKSSQMQKSSKRKRDTSKPVGGFAGVHPLDIGGNPSYASHPSTPVGFIGEYSLAGHCEESKESDGSASQNKQNQMVQEIDRMKDTGNIISLQQPIPREQSGLCTSAKAGTILSDKVNAQQGSDAREEGAQELGLVKLARVGDNECGLKKDDDYIDSGYSLVT